MKKQGNNKSTLYKNRKGKKLGTPHQIIVINGHRYDARTGKRLDAPVHHATTPKKHVKRDPGALSHAVHATAQKSHTLMRHAVKKPQRTATHPEKIRVRTQTFQDVTVRLSGAAQQLLQHPNERERVARALKIKQSDLVAKFNSAVQHTSQTTHKVQKRVEQLAVQPVPAHVARDFSSSTFTTAAERLLSKGLHSASSHNQTSKHAHRPKRSRRARLTSVGAAGLAAIMLGLFITYQNVPNISVRYASSKAGISARIPGWQPSGFAMQRAIRYQPGEVSLQFQSNSDERTYVVRQRASNWNSETLRNNYVASNNGQVHTYEEKGRTIFIYDENNATWVNGGVWYEIEGDAKLTSDQLLRIATSM